MNTDKSKKRDKKKRNIHKEKRNREKRDDKAKLTRALKKLSLESKVPRKQILKKTKKEPQPQKQEPKPSKQEPKRPKQEPKPAKQEPKPAKQEPKPAKQEPKAKAKPMAVVGPVNEATQQNPPGRKKQPCPWNLQCRHAD